MDRLLVGRTLGGRYQVGEVLGRGGMSIVYLGFDQRLERDVAVKVIGNVGTPEGREELRARFRREAGAAARLPHQPNVVQIFDYGTDPELDLDYIVMELVRGRDLKQALSEGGFAVGDAVHILRGTARAIAAGHRVGVVHRDVKPANVLLPVEDGRETARVVDFGIAKLVAGTDELTVAGHAPYSPAYASPEQLAGATRITPASDVYQLGLLGYELLAGERPFSREDRERMARGDAVRLPLGGSWNAVPASLQAVVKRALAPTPEARFADAAAFADALEASAIPAAAPPLLPAATPIGASAAVDRRRPVWAALPWPLIGVGLLVLLVLWGLTGRGGDHPPEPGAVMASNTTPPPPAVSEVGTEPEPQAGAVTARTPARDGSEAQAAVMAAVADLNRAWVEGDLERHIAHYGRRVDYYNSKRLARSGVLRDRRRDLNRYPEREITIERQLVQFPEQGRARVLADKSWRFGGGERERSGKGLQEYVLQQRDDGRWVVVSEQLLEEFRTERRTDNPED
ncbi:hypothetical protein BH23GEM5_BH23GEM5_11180 [soil metagenome]